MEGRTWLAWAGAASGVLAGCLDGGRGDERDARTFEWGISDCAFVIAEALVDAQSLAAVLPENFTPTRVGLLGGPLAGSDPAYLAFDAYRCREGMGLEGPVEDLAYGSIYTGVAVPDALLVEGYGLYFVKWDPLVPDADRREAFAAAGIPARAGDAAVRLTEVPGAGWAVEADVTLEGVGGFSVRGLAAQPVEGDPVPFAEYTPLTGGGLAQWRARLHGHTYATGVGSLELAPGTWAAELLGGSVADVRIIAGAWNLDEASVTSPYS